MTMRTVLDRLGPVVTTELPRSSHWIRVFSLLAVCAAAFGGQSVVVNSGMPLVTLPNSAPWTSIGDSNQSMRWEMRIHDFGTDWATTATINLGPVLLRSLTPNYAMMSSVTGDSFMGDGAGTYLNGCCAGRSDVLVRVQRDVVNNRYTWEIWNTQGGGYLKAFVSIATLSPVSWAGVSLRLYSGTSVSFLRWYSSVVPLGTPIRVGGVTGDLGNWEFEGNLNDTSGRNLKMSGGTTTYTQTPTYPPVCDAGTSQSFRAGFPGQLDGTQSSAEDGGGGLRYIWQQLSGPRVGWRRRMERGGLDERAEDPTTARNTAQPIITGLVAGSYTFKLTVTDESEQSSVCTVTHGAVETDDKDVVITRNGAVDTLLGPMVRYGANPWPWFDDRHRAVADVQIANMDAYYGAYWDVADPGTVTVTTGSTAVSGSGTSFTTTICQGPGAPSTPKASLIIWYPTDVPGQTGRRTMSVASCESDTQLTLKAIWTSDVSDGSGLSYSNDARSGTWAYNPAPANYYDNVAAYYALYHRSGIVAYRDAARKLADRFWTCPQIDRGAAYVINSTGAANVATFPSRSMGLLGLVLRARDGRPDMWAGLHKIWEFYNRVYLGPSGYNARWLPGLWDVREVAYQLAGISYCALFDPDPVYQGRCKGWISEAIPDYFARARFPDGGWHQLLASHSSWSGASSTATLTHGSTLVVGTGTAWTAAQFASGSGGQPSLIWFTDSSARPSSNAEGDPTYYTPRFVDATHLTLDRPYEGTTGAHGWALASASESTAYLGYGAMPYMEGILAAAFDLASKAISDSDPANSALARQFNLSAANWIATYGYRPAVKAVYYGAQYVNCRVPIPEGFNPCTGTTSISDARVLSAEALRGIMTAYAYSKEDNLKNLADVLFNAMWAKPSTCQDGSALCVPDGSYITSFDNNGWYMTGTPPTGQAPKWFGQMWGFSGLSAWPAYRVGGPQPQIGARVYVGFDPATIRGAVSLRITSTAPNGAVWRTECATSPCVLNTDGTAGDQIMTLEYLSSSGKTLAVSDIPLVGGH